MQTDYHVRRKKKKRNTAVNLKKRLFFGLKRNQITQKMEKNLKRREGETEKKGRRAREGKDRGKRKATIELIGRER